MMLLIQIDFSSAQFNILHWGLSAYRKSLSDGMTVGSGGSAKWNRCSKVFVLAELVQFVIKCVIFSLFMNPLVTNMGHIWNYDLVRSCFMLYTPNYGYIWIDLVIWKDISYFPNFGGKNWRYIFFKYEAKYDAERGTLVGGKLITFIIFALKVSDFVGASVPY